MKDSGEFGRQGEELAASFLEEKGYQILKRNQRTPYGEIDLIVREKNIIIFVEVKSRSTEFFGSPADAVNAKKQERIRQSGLWWLHETGEKYEEIRFDVIGIIKKKKSPWEISHWIGGFE